MKLSTQVDIRADCDTVFAAATDFRRLERQAFRRGVEVQRLDRLEGTRAGMRWSLRFAFRGKSRQLQAEIDRCLVPKLLSFRAIAGDGIEVGVSVVLLALAPSTTRLTVALDMLPRTLPARLLIQSLVDWPIQMSPN